MHPRKAIIASIFVLFGAAALVGIGAFAGVGVFEYQGAAFMQEYPDLARGFLRGSLGLEAPGGASRVWRDVSPFGGKVYLPFGPLPAAFFLPLAAAFDGEAPVGALSAAVLIAAAVLTHRIARAVGLDRSSAGWMAAAYAVGSAFFPLALGNLTSWLAIAIANVFLLAALHEQLTTKRPIVTGIFLACALLTRSVSVIGLGVFVAAMTMLDAAGDRPRLRTSVLVILPVLAAVVLQGAYNEARFGSIAEMGYAYQVADDPAAPRPHGEISPWYVPRNLWYLALAPFMVKPEFPFLVPNLLGMGLLFGSPYLLYAARARWRDRRVRVAAVAAALGLAPALMYVWTGAYQIGYRYAVDVYPLLFLVLMSAFAGGVPRTAKALIASSAVLHVVWLGSFMARPELFTV
jgi:hypothetical protein